MQKRIAIPVENNVLCAHFGHCQSFNFVDVENDKITKTTEIVPPAHEPGLYPAWVKQQGATDVICGGLGERAKILFNQQEITLHIGAPVKTPKELVTDLLAGTLQTGNNTCNHHHDNEDCHKQ
jgi:predicted Fe-Mo cluster-binding NifX family protein